MARTNKPTKTMQINHLRDMVDKYHEGMYHLMGYMDFYGLTLHYQSWVDALANNKDLPNKLEISDVKAEKPKEKDGESKSDNTDS